VVAVAAQQEGLVTPLESSGEATKSDLAALVGGIERLGTQLKGLSDNYDSQIASVEQMKKDSPESGALRGNSPPATSPVAEPSNAGSGMQGYEVLENTPQTKLPYWRPSTSGHIGHPDQPLPWAPPFPELCKYKVTDVSESNKLPGYGSKRVALAFRGDSFRGLSYGKTICQLNKKGNRVCGKLPFYCTKKAREIQKATAKSHLKNIVGALEKQGLAVDIYIATYGCSGIDHVTDAEAQEYYDELISWYQPYVKAHRMIQRVPGMTQDTGTQRTAQLLLDNAPLDYQSVLMWRFDMPTTMPMEVSGLMTPEHNEQAWADWETYATKSAWFFYWYDDDWGYSFPGWFLNCALSTFLHNCMDNDLHCQWGVRANFPGDVRMVWHEGGSNQRFNVYRNDYDKQGRPVCEYLEKNCGGPSCGSKPEDSWREACRQIKAISNSSWSWDNLQKIDGIPETEWCKPGQFDISDSLPSLDAGR
jgi:hypothetical protein